MELNSGMNCYSKRFVAFIDILGFTDIIRRTALPEPGITIDEIVAALDIPSPAEKGKLIIGSVGDISNSDHKITQFSDSLIISTNYSDAGLLHLIDHIEKIAFSFLKMGFLCRGGIASGLLFHEENVVFGPAMIEAYQLESSEAICPRIVLSKEVETYISSMAGGERIVIDRKLFRYPDFFAVHVLRRLAFVLSTPGEGNEWEMIYLAIKRHLIAEIARLVGEPKKREKVVSFMNYFNETVTADPLKLMRLLMKNNNEH
jgi:hypothetical protein